MTEFNCRFCGTKLNHVFADLGSTPIANDYIKEENLHSMEPFYPLEVYVCDACFLVQLPEHQSAENIFAEDYTYFSSYSDSWLKHASDYVDMMVDRFEFDQASKVIELASNDGYLLQYFKQKGVPILGIEPAANVAEVAEKNGIPSVVKFFGVQTANELVDDGIQADLVLGNNVLAHVPDINDFVKGMKIILKEQGVITMEFPHLLRLIELNQFDTIYHEHFSYLSFTTVEKIFAKHGLTLFDVEELPTHGGSLRIFARHQQDEGKPITDRVVALRDTEANKGFTTLEHYLSYQAQIDKTKRNLLKFLIDEREKGKTIVGYGAPAKGNTLLNYCGVGTDFIQYTVDRSPAKKGSYLPGTRIPIYDPEKISETRPDYILILPWNLKDEIIKQMANARSWGCKFVVPIPSVEVID
ncbi:MAG: class I SAM-dependent methyltransferase [Gammaproteobacteria bacterium]|nr:class I SAM-dependent methyltransferase [Gammaproteobacteria bacterium]